MRRILLFLLAAGLVLVSGCVKMHAIMNIGPDGSGTVTVNYSMTQNTADVLKEMSAISNKTGNEEIPSLDDFDRAKLEKRAAKNGVTIKRFERTDADGREGLDMELAFKNVTGLSRVLSSGGDNKVMKIFRTADGNYVLETVDDDNPPEPEEETESKDSTAPAVSDTTIDPQKSMELMGKLMQSMNELDIRMEITVPGDIVSSNAPETDGRSSIWAVNAANMMQAQGMDTDPKIIFSGKGLKIDAPAEPK